MIEMLSNTSYIGLDYYGKTRMVGGERGKPTKVDAPREEWIEITGFSPRLVSDTLFKQVQERLAGAQARRLSMNEYTYMMTSFARCGKCGRPMHGTNASQGHRYYRCNGTRPRRPGLRKECDASPVPGGMVGRGGVDIVGRYDSGPQQSYCGSGVETRGRAVGTSARR